MPGDPARYRQGPAEPGAGGTAHDHRYITRLWPWDACDGGDHAEAIRMNPNEPFEERLSSALADLVQPLSSDYLPDLVVRTRRVRQRPAWTFPERWFPMTVITRRASPSTLGGLRVALGLGAAILLALIIAIGMLLATGSAPTSLVTAPRNGLIAYQLDGDIWV